MQSKDIPSVVLDSWISRDRNKIHGAFKRKQLLKEKQERLQRKEQKKQ